MGGVYKRKFNLGFLPILEQKCVVQTHWAPFLEILQLYHGPIFGYVMSLRGDYECSRLAFYT